VEQNAREKQIKTKMKTKAQSRDMKNGKKLSGVEYIEILDRTEFSFWHGSTTCSMISTKITKVDLFLLLTL